MKQNDSTIKEIKFAVNPRCRLMVLRIRNTVPGMEASVRVAEIMTALRAVLKVRWQFMCGHRSKAKSVKINNVRDVIKVKEPSAIPIIMYGGRSDLLRWNKSIEA